MIMDMTANKTLLTWVDEMAEMLKPDSIVWIDGSEKQLEQLRQQALAEGEIIKLNEEKLPGSYLHLSAQNDVARVEDRTYICTKSKEDAGAKINWEAPDVMYAKLRKLFTGSMKGRTMYVIPYSMGIVGSPFAKYGVELSDSIYVVLNMDIMTRIGKSVLDAIGTDGEFVKGVHSKGTLSLEDRFIAHFPEDNTIWSVNSGYGGNVLLGKKCFALRMASYQGKNEEWLAEHMLILGIEDPQGETTYITAAFPSACGKTNLAMLIPPEGFIKEGYKVWCVGDDIAWLRVGPDGRLWAVNPENGFFGVAPGTSDMTNPNALATVQKNTIFTNVVHNLDDNTVWWEGMGVPAPENAINWKGEPWKFTGVKGEEGAHANSRFTTPASQCPCISPEFEKPDGVPISAIVFGGRRAKTVPLVYEARDWQQGVFAGSIMASETTAAAAGQVGVTRRDPMAMLPFFGYNVGDYFAHWLEMGEKATHPPKIFTVNWFRVDDDGKFLWPGYGENMRVLKWIVDRCEGKAGAVESAIGFLPEPSDIDTRGLDISADTMDALLYVDKDLWKEDMDDVEKMYNEIGERMPKALLDELAALKSRLAE